MFHRLCPLLHPSDRFGHFAMASWKPREGCRCTCGLDLTGCGECFCVARFDDSIVDACSLSAVLCIAPEFGSAGTRFGFQTAIYPCRPLAAWRLLRSDQIKPTTRRSETHSRRHINRHFFHRQLSPTAFASEGDCYSSWHSSSDVNYSALRHRVHFDLHPIKWHGKCFADARTTRLQP